MSYIDEVCEWRTLDSRVHGLEKYGAVCRIIKRGGFYHCQIVCGERVLASTCLDGGNSLADAWQCRALVDGFLSAMQYAEDLKFQ